MAIPANTITETGALHDAVRKHPEYGFILALVCLALSLVVASLIFTPEAVGAGMNSESWFVGP
jgi:hypothetical protein